MDDYISRDEAIRIANIGTISINEEIALLKKIKSADVRENIHGHWIDKGDGIFQCSICGKVELWQGVFCASCGADMREDQNE